MEFDAFTAVLLVLRPDAPDLAPAIATSVQDAHLAHLATLHESGELLVAGPLGDEEVRGLCVFRGTAEEVTAIMETDPAVRAGRLSVVVMPWEVPAGAVSFATTRFPRSMSDVTG